MEACEVPCIAFDSVAEGTSGYFWKLNLTKIIELIN